MEKIQEMLFEMQDHGYKEFHSKLMPTVEQGKIIGVRVPILRKLAKELYKVWMANPTGERCYTYERRENKENLSVGKSDVEDFLKTLPHQYYEEDNLHAFLIEGIKDYEDCILALNDFLPYIDNWATCDSLKPKAFKKNKEKLLDDIDIWLKADSVYEVRFAMNMLMTHYLDADFKPEYLEKVASVINDEYYINMMKAWYFATALAKQYEVAIVYVEKRLLPEWVHKKTIQKAIESYRISSEKKTYLKSLR